MSDQRGIRPVRELNIMAVIAVILLAPIMLVIWLATLFPLTLWLTASVILSSLTGRDWFVLSDYFPRVGGTDE